MIYFHIYSDPKKGVRRISQQLFHLLRCKPGVCVGWIDKKQIMISKSSGVLITITKNFEKILSFIKEENPIGIKALFREANN